MKGDIFIGGFIALEVMGEGGGGGRTHALHHPVSKWQYIMTDVLDGSLDPLSDTLVGPVLIKGEWICYLSFYSYLFFLITQAGEGRGVGKIFPSGLRMFMNFFFKYVNKPTKLCDSRMFL